MSYGKVLPLCGFCGVGTNCMLTFIISEARRTGVSFDERMLSSFSVKIIVAILIFPTVEGWVEEELSTKGVGKRKEMGGVEQ